MVLIATLCLATLASALTLNVPTDWKSSSSNTITWTSTSGDPESFSIELVQPQLLNGPLAIVGQANTSEGSLTFNLPAVPEGSGYTLEAVGISNIMNVLDTSGSFSISPAPEETPTSTTAGGATPSSTAPTTPGSSSPIATTTVPVSESAGGSTSTSPVATNPGNAADPAAALPHVGILTAGLWVGVGVALMAL